MRRCDHHSDPFSLERSRSESRNETNTGQDRVENICFCPETSSSIRIQKTFRRRVLLRGVGDGVRHDGWGRRWWVTKERRVVVVGIQDGKDANVRCCIAS